MPVKYLILWIGSIGVFPTLYYVFSRKDDFDFKSFYYLFYYVFTRKEDFDRDQLNKDKKVMWGIIFLSFYTYILFGFLLKIDLNVRVIPTSIKY